MTPITPCAFFGFRGLTFLVFATHRLNRSGDPSTTRIDRPALRSLHLFTRSSMSPHDLSPFPQAHSDGRAGALCLWGQDSQHRANEHGAARRPRRIAERDHGCKYPPRVADSLQTMRPRYRPFASGPRTSSRLGPGLFPPILALQSVFPLKGVSL